MFSICCDSSGNDLKVATSAQRAHYLHAVLWFPMWFTASAACDATCPDLNCHSQEKQQIKQTELRPG